MPDVVESRAIEDLPSVSNVTSDIQFPVSQNGTAMRISVGDIEETISRTDIVNLTLHVASSSGMVPQFSITSDKTASQIYDTVVNKKRNVLALLPGGSGITSYGVFKIEYVEKNGNDYTAFFYAEKPLGNKTEYAIDNSGNVTVTETYDVTEPNKNTLYTGDARLSLNYVPSSDLHAVNKAYVDAAVSSGGGGNDSLDIVVVTFNSSDNKVYHNGEAITGSQINNRVTNGDIVFLWHDGYQRIYTFSETVGSGGAKFLALGENGTVSITVQPTSNATITGSSSFLPVVNYYNDEGKVLGVVEGAWAKTGRILPAVTADDNGMVLGVVNGNWTLVDPSSFNE